MTFPKTELKLPGVSGKKVVLDTITTRFLMLFLIFLFIPLFSLIFFTANLLQADLDQAAQFQLHNSDAMVQSKLEQERGMLEDLAAGIARSHQKQDDLNSLCPENKGIQCFLLEPQAKIMHSQRENTESWGNLPPLELGMIKDLAHLQQAQSFFSYWKGGFYIFAASPMVVKPLNKAGQNSDPDSGPVVVVGRLIDSPFLNGLFKKNAALTSTVWIVSEPIQPGMPKWIAETQGAKLPSLKWNMLPALEEAPMELQTSIELPETSYQVLQRFLFDEGNQKVARIVHILPMRKHQALLSHYYYGIYFIALTSLLLAVLLAMMAARSITQPLLKLVEQVDILSRTGDLSKKIDIRGVHEINRLSESFNRMLERLRLEHQMKDEFVATLTHDLKVPMLAEKQSLDHLDKELYGSLTSIQREVIQLMQSANQSVLRLVNGILEVYRYDAGQVSLIFDKIDIAALLEETVAELRSLVQEKHIQLTVQNDLPDAEGGMVRADRLELKRVLVNLISNAITNTPKHGSISCQLTNDEVLGCDYVQKISLFQQTSLKQPLKMEGRVLVSIQDSGIGFMTEDLPGLFKRFAANKGRNPMSIGLGLYNCYQVIAAHQGVLWVETTEGEGAAVSFLLPMNDTVALERRRYGDRRKN